MRQVVLIGDSIRLGCQETVCRALADIAEGGEMNFPSDAPVKAVKLAALREKLARLGLPLGEVEEHFIRASGPGGQKVNKTESGVQLRYGELTVKWTRERSRALNRFLALRALADAVERRVSPATSPVLAEQARRRKQKDRRRRRRGA